MDYAHTIWVYVLVALGAAIGGVARFWCVGVVAWLAGETFPWGTLAVNVTGSALLGFFATMTAPEGRVFVPASARLMVTVGICGGFTTFSTFSIETLAMVLDRQSLKACLNVAASVAACLIGVWCGYAGATALSQR